LTASFEAVKTAAETDALKCTAMYLEEMIKMQTAVINYVYSISIYSYLFS
jgi:hypothetical protein